jgi:hypothetical protein
LEIKFYVDDVRIYSNKMIPNFYQIIKEHYKEYGMKINEDKYAVIY